MVDLLYLAKPKFGGWVSFTSHLSLKHKYPLFKIAKRNEKTKREFGYGVKYQNLKLDKILERKNKILITAIDKKYYNYLDDLPDETGIVIHDPTEVRGNAKKKLRKNLNRFRIITIRKSVKNFIYEKYGLKSKFIPHPFYRFPIDKVSKSGAVSISRIDYDKHIEMIVEANKKIVPPIDIYGFKNDLYVYRVLSHTEFPLYYKGKFNKNFSSLKDILKNKKYVIDMSIIKNDGGGSQYTFLEAIHCGCILVLNKKWITPQSVFKHNENCLVVDNVAELSNVITNQEHKTILENSKELLKSHIQADWTKLNIWKSKWSGSREYIVCS